MKQTFISLNRKKTQKFETETRNNFYLSFCSGKKQYEEVYINGFWIIKSYNPDTDQCQAALFSNDSYKAYKGKGS